jgi:CHAT domain-containing protein/tetratricopeptide (TPR) repeat protein
VRRLRAALRLAADRADPVRGRLLVSLAWAEAERGRVDLGFRLLDEASLLLPASALPLLHAQRAVLLRRNGRTDRAAPEFDRAIAGLTDPLDLVKALNNRALLRLDTGRVSAAREDLGRALTLARRHALTMMAAVAQMNLGCLDYVSGDLPTALGTFSAIRPVYESVVPGRVAVVDIERARALVAAGLFREADRCLAGALARATSQGQDHTRADALQVRAEAALLAGNPLAAATWSATARSGFRRRGNPRHAALAALLSLRATAQLAPTAAPTPAPTPFWEGSSRTPPPEKSRRLSTGDGEIVARGRRLAAELQKLKLPEDARVAAFVTARALIAGGRAKAAERLIERYGRPGRHDRLDTRLLWRLTRAELARAKRQPETAERELAAGMVTLHRQRGRFGCLDLQTGASAHGRDIARAGLGAALESGRFGAIFRWSERARAQALLLPPVRPPADPATAAALEDLRQTRQAIRTAELRGARPSPGLRVRADELSRAIREAAWSVPGAAGAGAKIATPAGTRAALGDAVLVAYLDTGERLAAIVLGRGTATVVELGERRTAEEAVLRLRADLDTAAGRAMPERLAKAVAQATQEDARRLAAIVIDPIRRRIRDDDLVIVPTGLLATAPWSVLPGLARRPVTVAPSATAWLARRGRRRSNGRTVLVAGPGNQRGPEEVRAIAGRRPGATVLTGAEATPAATLAAIDGAAVAHLAAHGRHEAQNALFSSLELHGGPVLGYDLQRLEEPPELVVLAGCELGLSEVRPGDESFGMASALLAAGTATVVASVSRVADDAASEVMVGLHRRLAAGRTPAEALALEAAGTGFVCLGR